MPTALRFKSYKKGHILAFETNILMTNSCLIIVPSDAQAANPERSS